MEVFPPQADDVPKDIFINKEEALELISTFDHDQIHCCAWRAKERALFSRNLTV